jgi:hypothetical protein
MIKKQFEIGLAESREAAVKSGIIQYCGGMTRAERKEKVNEYNRMMDEQVDEPDYDQEFRQANWR